MTKYETVVVINDTQRVYLVDGVSKRAAYQLEQLLGNDDKLRFEVSLYDRVHDNRPNMVTATISHGGRIDYIRLSVVDAMILMDVLNMKNTPELGLCMLPEWRVDDATILIHFSKSSIDWMRHVHDMIYRRNSNNLDISIIRSRTYEFRARVSCGSSDGCHCSSVRNRRG